MSMPFQAYESGEYLSKNPTWDIEDSAWKANEVLKILKKNNLAPKNLVEVGCGAGGILASLQDARPDIEYSGYEIASSAETFWEAYKSRKIAFKVEDFLHTKTPHFDTLLLLDVIEHLPNPFDFMNALRGRSENYILHIPLDLSAVSVTRETPLLKVRSKVGHIRPLGGIEDQLAAFIGSQDVASMSGLAMSAADVPPPPAFGERRVVVHDLRAEAQQRFASIVRKNRPGEDCWNIANEGATVTAQAVGVADKTRCRAVAPVGIKRIEHRAEHGIDRDDFHEPTRDPTHVSVVGEIERARMFRPDAAALKTRVREYQELALHRNLQLVQECRHFFLLGTRDHECARSHFGLKRRDDVAGLGRGVVNGRIFKLIPALAAERCRCASQDQAAEN